MLVLALFSNGEALFLAADDGDDTFESALVQLRETSTRPQHGLI
jgi:hypothetical protein